MILRNDEIAVLDDFSSVSDSAIRYAATLAAASGKSLLLLHVVNSDEQLEEAGSLLQKRAHATGMGDAARGLAMSGDLFDCIKSVYREKHPWMLIFGTHGVKGIKQILFGAHSTHVVDSVACPVLILQENSDVPMGSGGKWLVLGNSTFQEVACNTLAENAKAAGAELEILYITMGSMEVQADDERNLSAIRKHLSQCGVNAILKIVPKEGIHIGLCKQAEQYAATHGHSCVVMSREGYPIVGKSIFDADREAMINNASCIPVMFI